MCDPVTATALALSAGGTMLETREANKNAKRMMNAKNAAYQTGMDRQKGYAEEGGQAFNTNVQKQGRTNFDEQKAQEAEKMQQAFATNRTQPADYTAGAPASAPKNVVIARQAANNKVDAETDRDVDNRSNLSGYSGALFNQGMDQNSFARLFGNLQDKAGHDAALIPMDMSAASNNASKAPSLFPSLLKAGGMAMGLYGAANGVNSFGDKVFQGPTMTGAPMPVQPGLFSKIKSIPGNFY